MRVLADLTTRGKLIFGFGVIVVAMALTSFVSWEGLARQRTLQQQLYDDDLVIVFKMLELRNAINRERVALLSSLVANSAAQAGFDRQLTAEEANIRGLLADLATRAQSDHEFAPDYARLSGAYHEYSAVRDNDVLASVRSGQRAAAGEAATGRLQNTYERLRTVAEEIGGRQLEEARGRMREGHTVALVSHDEEQIRSRCDRVLWIEHGRSVLEGGRDEVFAAYRRDLHHPAETA